MTMKVDRLSMKDWGFVAGWLAGHMESIGGGMRDEDIPVFKPMLAQRENWFLLASKGPVMGLFVFLKIGQKEFEAHAVGNVKGWGWIGLSRRVLRWFAQRSRAAKVRTFVPAQDVDCAVYVRACGMRHGQTARKGMGRFGEQVVRWFWWSPKKVEAV